jgi:CDP-paratose 2-epimerase
VSVVIVTGSSGLIGSETAKFFHEEGFDVVGIDNDMRAYFFGQDASTGWNTKQLSDSLPRFRHHAADIRDAAAIDAIFQAHGSSIALVVH